MIIRLKGQNQLWGGVVYIDAFSSLRSQAAGGQALLPVIYAPPVRQGLVV